MYLQLLCGTFFSSCVRGRQKEGTRKGSKTHNRDFPVLGLVKGNLQLFVCAVLSMVFAEGLAGWQLFYISSSPGGLPTCHKGSNR